MRVLALAAAAACGTEAPVPEKPTWFADVLPILRGSCFHCHGANITSAPPRDENDTGSRPMGRYDVCGDLDENPAFAGIGPFEDMVGLSSASGSALALVARLELDDPILRMPPAPASALSARDIEVLRKWAAEGNRECGDRPTNAKPKVRLVSKRTSGGNLTVVLDVTDGDADQVLGKLTCGEVSGRIPSTGRSSIKLSGVSGKNTLTALVSDGIGDAPVQYRLGPCP